MSKGQAAGSNTSAARKTDPLSRILLRAGKDPFTVYSPESALEDFPAGIFGKNVGNLVFSDSMHRILSTPGSQVLANTFLGERDGVT